MKKIRNLLVGLLSVTFLVISFSFVYEKAAAAIEDFALLTQVSGASQANGITVDSSNQNIYLANYNGDIYKRTYVAGQSSINKTFSPLYQTSRAWVGIAADSSNHNVYAVVAGGDIYKQTAGAGSFMALGQTSRNWYGVAVDSSNHNVYAAVTGGAIYKQTAGSGSFVNVDPSVVRNWYGVAVDSVSHDVYAVVFGGDIYKQTAGSGNFAALNQGTKQWRAIAIDPTTHDVYATVYNGNVFKQTAGSGNFVDLGAQPQNSFAAIAVDSTIHTLYANNGSNVYKKIQADLVLPTGAYVPAVTVNVPVTFTQTMYNGGNASTGSSFNNFFQVATAANGGGTITDLASSSQSAIAGNSCTYDSYASCYTNPVTITSPSYTFTSTGTRSVRACADKSNRNDTGTIYEYEEGNNCGSWVNVTVNPPPMSGTLTIPSPSCVIAVGGSSCTVNSSWSIANPVGTPTAITASGMSNVNVTNTLTTPQSGNQTLTVPYGGRTFYLYNNAVQLATVGVSGASVTCTTPGSVWNGSICAASVNGTPGTANGKTYSNGTTSYGSDTQCATGTSNNTAFPASGGSVSWNCIGSNGGTNSGPHSASRSAPSYTVSINVSTQVIFTGDSTTLTWSSNAPSCTGTNFDTGGAPSGSVSIHPTSTVTYTVTCSGISGQTTVTVNRKPGFIEN